MMQLRETAHPPVSHLVTGHFREQSGYSTWRSLGTRDWLLIFTASGLGRFGYRGGQFIARRGDLVLLSPGTVHDYGVEDSLKRWELIWTHFYPRSHWHELLNWPAISPGLFAIRLQAEADIDLFESMMLEMHRLANSAARLSEMLAMNALERVLLECDAHNPLSSQAQLDPRIRRAMEFVCANLAAEHTIPGLVDAVVAHFSA